MLVEPLTKTAAAAGTRAGGPFSGVADDQLMRPIRAAASCIMYNTYSNCIKINYVLCVGTPPALPARKCTVSPPLWCIGQKLDSYRQSVGVNLGGVGALIKRDLSVHFAEPRLLPHKA